MFPDWDVSGEDAGDKQLWEDNWDDDNVEDDFSCQLRCVSNNFLPVPLMEYKLPVPAKVASLSAT